MPTDLRHSIIRVLAYFDLFDYPVSMGEIFSFLDQPISMEKLAEALQQLLKAEIIFLSQHFYTIQDNDALTVRRIAGNRRAQPLLRIGRRISRFLFQIPYVRAIGISGSLSKNFAGEDADIDYFIITKANRLWIARTMMHLFKKLSFLFGRQHWYCMNYYIDEEALEIEEKNIFTAIELITLLPVRGDGVLQKFINKNDWANVFYPNYRLKISDADTLSKDSKLKRFMESLFNNRFGDWLDNYLMKVTTYRWNRKEEQQKRSVKGTRMSLHTGKHFSKPNPVYFQKEILVLYNDKLSNMAAKWDKNLV